MAEVELHVLLLRQQRDDFITSVQFMVDANGKVHQNRRVIGQQYSIHRGVVMIRFSIVWVPISEVIVHDNNCPLLSLYRPRVEKGGGVFPRRPLAMSALSLPETAT